jgi:hypothetical protein
MKNQEQYEDYDGYMEWLMAHEDECKPSPAEMLIQSLSHLIEEDLNDLEAQEHQFLTTGRF